MNNPKWTVGRIQELRGGNNTFRAPLQSQSLPERMREHQPIMKLASDLAEENEQLRAQLAGSEEALLHVQQESAALREELDGMRKIVDAAVGHDIASEARNALCASVPYPRRFHGFYQDAKRLYTAELEAQEALSEAVREYRKLKEVQG